MQIGVTLMIMLSGMHMKLEHLLHVGKRATAVALCGTALPIACGIGVLAIFGVRVFPDGLAAGVTLAPTSVGIAIKLLTERKVLKAYYGQVWRRKPFGCTSLHVLAALYMRTGLT